MNTDGDKLDASEDPIFDPDQIPTRPEDERAEEQDGGGAENAASVRAINKTRVAIVAAATMAVLFGAVVLFGVFRGSSSEETEEPFETHVEGTSAEKEVERLEKRRSKSLEEPAEPPPDGEAQLKEQTTRAERLEELERKLEERPDENNTEQSANGEKGPWEQARERARRRHARTYHDEAFQAQRAEVFARLETPEERTEVGRDEPGDSRAESEMAGEVESPAAVREKMRGQRRELEQRLQARGNNKDGPLPASATEKQKFLREESQGSHQSVHRLREPPSPYVVQAGTMLPLVLETGIESELPGLLRGRFASPVYDSTTGNHLLVPAGSTILGKYNSKIEEGQRRVQVVWTRLILPNGKSLQLGNIPGVDLQGKSGYSDLVDNQWGQVGAGVALTSLLSAGAGAAAGPQSSLSQSPEQGALRGAGRNATQTGKGIVDRELDKKPRLIIRPGMRVGALVHEDLVLEPYRSQFNRYRAQANTREVMR